MKRRIAVLDYSGEVYERLSVHFLIDAHFTNLHAYLEYQKQVSVDELFVALSFEDSDFVQSVKHLKAKQIYFVGDYESKKFDSLLEEHNVNRYEVKPLEVIKEFPFKRKTKGYTYTKSILKEIKDPNVLLNVSLVYELTSVKFSVKPSSVERAIRYYKEQLFNDGALEEWFDHFPTNGTFIQTLHRLQTAYHFEL